MNCPNCGAEIDKNTNFCSNCGQKLSDAAAYFGCEIAVGLGAAKFGTAFLYALCAAKILIIAAYALTLYFWQRGLDKKLVFTPRVKRFFAIFRVVRRSNFARASYKQERRSLAK